MATQSLGLQPTEILQVDTVDSQKFFERLQVNASEMCECQRLVNDLFSQCCQKHGGYVQHWLGDGGFAFFPASLQSGQSILAAREFLFNLHTLTQQTATVLDRSGTPNDARR